MLPKWRVDNYLLWIGRPLELSTNFNVSLASLTSAVPSVFARVALLLTQLLKTKGKTETEAQPNAPLWWSAACNAPFTKLKGLFTLEPISAHPNDNHQFIVQVEPHMMTTTALDHVSTCQGNLMKWNTTGQRGEKKRRLLNSHW